MSWSRVNEHSDTLHSETHNASDFDIYIYAFSRRFYPKRLTVHSGYTFFISMCVPWELNPQPFALLTQCSTTEPQEHWYANHTELNHDFRFTLINCAASFIFINSHSVPLVIRFSSTQEACLGNTAASTQCSSYELLCLNASLSVCLQIIWFWFERIRRGLKLWDTAETEAWTWCRWIRSRCSDGWRSCSWKQTPPPITCGWVCVIHTYWGSGSGSAVTPSATITGLLIMTPDWTTAIIRSDPEPFGPTITTGSAALKLIETTSSASSECWRVTDYM